MATSGVLATYRATRQDDREVAVTVIDCAEATFVDRFRRESEVLLSLSRSPKIVTVHEAGMTSGGSPYLVLDPSDEALDELVAAEGPMAEAEASRILADAAEAIADSHLIGVVHRCLGPGAIRRSDDGNFRVANFCVGSLTGATLDRQLGYVAPEARKAGSGHMGAAVDVYSLGATLLHLVTGRDPSDPDALEGVRSGPVRDLIAAAMDFDPARRPSALELQRRLVELSRLEATPTGDAEARPSGSGEDLDQDADSAPQTGSGEADRNDHAADADDPGSVDELLAELIQPAAPASDVSGPADQPPPPRPHDRVPSQPSATPPDEAADDDAPGSVRIDLEAPATPDPAAEHGPPPATDPAAAARRPDVRIAAEQPPPPTRDVPLDLGPLDAEPPPAGVVTPAPVDAPSVDSPVDASWAPPVDASWAPPVVEEPPPNQPSVPDPTAVDEGIETVDLADVLDTPAAKAAWQAAISGSNVPPDEPPAPAPNGAAASGAGPSATPMPTGPGHPTMDHPVVRSSIVAQPAPAAAGSLDNTNPIDPRRGRTLEPGLATDRRIARFDGPRRRRSPAEIVDDIMIRVRPLLGLFGGMIAGLVLLAGAYYVLEQRGAQVDDPAAGASSTALPADGLVVPVVVDLDVDAASSRLENAGFDITVLWEFDPARPRGQVLESDPGAGEAAPIGSTVSLVVSRGPEPTCAGSNEAAVRRQLEGRGLEVAGVTRSTNDAIAAGLVVRCLIYDDTETAVIIVSDGPREADS